MGKLVNILGVGFGSILKLVLYFERIEVKPRTLLNQMCVAFDN